MNTKLLKILIRMSRYAIYGIILMTSMSLAFAFDGKAQKRLKEIRTEIGFEKSSLSRVLKNIEERTAFRFAYKKSELPDIKIDLSAKSRSMEELLKAISDQSGLSFKRIDNTIHIRPLSKDWSIISDNLYSQEITVTGLITDASGMGLPGATVFIKGTSLGTITDVDGVFSLAGVDENDILVVSFIGYQTKEIAVAGQTNIKITLEEDIANLEEIVVVGYGTQKRSDITGSVVSIPKDRLSNLPVTNLMQAIQGTAAGLNITTTSSVPGSSGSMQIRGVNSINANTSPFIVLDGVPFFGLTNDINPNDIASIEILKDASAVAIYGNRGANGVILITTKRGTDYSGKPTVSYNGYVGFESMAHVLEPMGADQYVQKYADFMEANGLAQTGVLPNSSEIDNYNAGITTDWLDEATQPGRISDHSINISGGTENVQYYVSGSHIKQDGVVKGYQYKKSSFRANLDSKINEVIKIGATAFFTENNYDGGRVNLLEATAMSPYSVPRDENGDYIIFPMSPEQLFKNPLLGLTSDRLERGRNLTGSGYAEITPFIEGLKYRVNATYTYNLNRAASYTGRQANDQNGTAWSANWETTNWVLENILSYGKDFGKHHVDFTGLYSAQSVDYFRTDATSVIFINDALSYYNMGAGVTQSNSSAGNGYTMLSQMARINYSYDEKYLLTLTARRDGYSAFGSNTDKYGLFPSLALGWNLHNESFISGISAINQLKLRFSHGLAGNQAIGVNQTVSTASTVQYPFNGTALTGVLYNALGNADLNWETTTSSNLALDFGLVKGRLAGTIEVYKTKTDDILLLRNLPTTSGYSNVWANLGEMQNKGLEITLNTVNIERGNFSWESNINFSTYKNEILELYGDGEDDLGNRWFIGQPVRVIYDYEKLGIWQEEDDIASVDPVGKAGDLKFKDQNGDGQINSDDMVVIGQRDPKWIGGLTNTFKYKNFSLSVFLQTSQGGLRSNRDLTYADEAWRRNLPKGFKYWTPENKDNYWPSLAAYTNYKGYQFAEDYSYIRIKDVRLGYNLPSELLEKYGFKSMTVYVTGRNLHTFTDWFGWDPEISYSSRGSSNWTNNYPLVRTISIGLNLSL